MRYLLSLIFLTSWLWAQDEPTVKVIQSKTALYTFDTACWYKPNDSAKALLNLNQGTLLVDLDTMDWGSLRSLRPKIKFGQQLGIAGATGLVSAGGGYLLDQSVGIPGLFTVIGFFSGFTYTVLAISDGNQNRRTIDLYDLKESSDNFRHYFVKCDPKDMITTIRDPKENHKFRQLLRTNESYTRNNLFVTMETQGRNWRKLTPYYYNMRTSISKTEPFEKWGEAMELCKTTHTVRYLDLENRRIEDSLYSYRSLIFENSKNEAEPIQFHMDSLPWCSQKESLDSIKKVVLDKNNHKPLIFNVSVRSHNHPNIYLHDNNTSLLLLGLGFLIPQFKLYQDTHYLSFQFGGTKQQSTLFLNYQSYFPIFSIWGINPSYHTPITALSDKTFDLNLYLKLGQTLLFVGKSWNSVFGYKTESYSFGLSSMF